MMATAAVIGLSAGKRLLSSSSSSSSSSASSPSPSSSDIPDNYKLFYVSASASASASDRVSSTKNAVVPKRPPYSNPCFPPSHRLPPPAKAVTQRLHPSSFPISLDSLEEDEDGNEEDGRPVPEPDYSVEALLLLQKSMLETHWNLCFERTVLADFAKDKPTKKIPVTCSGISARQRRLGSRRKICSSGVGRPLRSPISPDLLQNRLHGYVKGVVSDDLLTHGEVVALSKKIKAGLFLEERKSRLKERLGWEPSDEQLATSLRISRAELRSRLIECSLAREKLAMSNVRLVLSIAQRYDNMGAEMSDLVQGGLIGLLRGIEKFDSSKGFKISTYVYWWIRQGVSRALVENSRTLRLPAHLHERLGLIRNAKVRLEEKGITPSIDRIAECLNMSQKKVRNATEAIGKVFSLDRDAFPSLNGLPGETHHSYIADIHIENNPWHGVDEWALKKVSIN
ncbi:RNA polymerase sigma factor sigA isoform X2 [Rhodamnia argentea]|uniref:RNA polymerase sigma factor sigA isoform X2 n=1 Tax=Rhodamnia argentea TaxID=178133 RepID=A0ABM3GT46_9MYRT|nr:RNA polymerase sigma factor sigA isoform X2 [Rhodamnia argentea]